MTSQSVGTRRGRALAATALFSAVGMSIGIDATLSPVAVRQAVQAGMTMRSPRNGYIWAPYVLHEYTNGIRIDPKTPLVDAVTVATPYERVRYNSYLAAFQGKSLSTAEAAQVARSSANHLTILLYTHSPISVQAELEAWQQTYVKHGNDQEVQRTYLDDFKPATLTVNGHTFTSTLKIEGPYQDSFSTQGKPEFRYLGVISYVFNLSPLVHNGRVTGVGELRFKDPTGRSYAQRIDLANYR